MQYPLYCWILSWIEHYTMPCISEPQAFHKRATFKWPWNENARTKNIKPFDCFIKGIQMGVAFWLMMQTLANGWKNLMPNYFLEITYFLALMSYCDTIDQSNTAFSVLGFSLKKKTKKSCVDLFTDWLIKEIVSTNWNHFSRSCENHSNVFYKCWLLVHLSFICHLDFTLDA